MDRNNVHNMLGGFPPQLDFNQHAGAHHHFSQQQTTMSQLIQQHHANGALAARLAANDAGVYPDQQGILTNGSASGAVAARGALLVTGPKPGGQEGLLVDKKTTETDRGKAAIFECDIYGCNTAFKTKFSLQRHYKKHYSKKEIKCRFCVKTFCLPQYKEEHEYTHTGEKPFACTFCSMRFRQRGKLSHHKKLCGNRPEAQNQTNHGNDSFEELKQTAISMQSILQSPFGLGNPRVPTEPQRGMSYLLGNARESAQHLE